MLLLSTTVALAQFGKLEDLGKKQGNEGNKDKQIEKSDENSIKNNTKMESIIKLQILEEAVKDGFFLVRQDYQLEEKKVPGSRYGWDGNSSFGYDISFLVRLKEGFITTSNIIYPWRKDENFSQYENTHNPVYYMTSTLKIGEKWKFESAYFNPKEKRELDNELLIVKDDEWPGGGFAYAAGYGKKKVYVVWLIPDGTLKETQSVRYFIEPKDLKITRNQYFMDLVVPFDPNIQQAVGGIVLEPVYNGIGQIELALIGVINNNEQPDDGSGEWHYTISLLLNDTDEANDVNNISPLTPNE